MSKKRIPRAERCYKVLDYLLENMCSITKACNESKIISFSEFYAELKINADLAKEYARACEIRSDYLFEELRVIAETPLMAEEHKDGYDGIKGSWTEKKRYDNTTRSKMIYDAALWQLTKMNPKKYGNKEVTSVEVNIPNILQNNPLSNDKGNDSTTEDIES